MNDKWAAQQEKAISAKADAKINTKLWSMLFIEYRHNISPLSRLTIHSVNKWLMLLSGISTVKPYGTLFRHRHGSDAETGTMWSARELVERTLMKDKVTLSYQLASAAQCSSLMPAQHDCSILRLSGDQQAATKYRCRIRINPIDCLFSSLKSKAAKTDSIFLTITRNNKEIIFCVIRPETRMSIRKWQILCFDKHHVPVPRVYTSRRLVLYHEWVIERETRVLPYLAHWPLVLSPNQSNCCWNY